MNAEIRIGTSGWHYPHWRGPFYPRELAPSRFLDFYAERFDTVELNNTFYRLPEPTSFEAWKKHSPPNFLFAVKGSRFLTHMKKLKEPEEGIARFFARAELLGRKMGPVLFQLPPRWKSNAERLRDFIRVLPKSHRYSFELRDRTWLNEEIYDILRKQKVAFCPYELGGFESPIVMTADFTYIRLHGPGAKYQGDYSREKLREWAKRIGSWRRELKAIYIYFDNDQAGYAAKNAAELKEMI